MVTLLVVPFCARAISQAVYQATGTVEIPLNRHCRGTYLSWYISMVFFLRQVADPDQHCSNKNGDASTIDKRVAATMRLAAFPQGHVPPLEPAEANTVAMAV